MHLLKVHENAIRAYIIVISLNLFRLNLKIHFDKMLQSANLVRQSRKGCHLYIDTIEKTFRESTNIDFCGINDHFNEFATVFRNYRRFNGTCYNLIECCTFWCNLLYVHGTCHISEELAAFLTEWAACSWK